MHTGTTTAASTADPGDVDFLRRAIALSRTNMVASEGGPFGAVLVQDGRVVGEGWNRVTSTNDPTAHAEVVAIRDACRALGTYQLTNATLYTSCEPCPMCLAAAYWARVERIVYAATREDAAEAGFDDAHIYGEVALPIAERRLPMVCHLSDEARAVFGEWIEKADKIPY
ncbi:MAG TPA: nucleoside deaminase [Azospirillum sp.]